LTSTTDGRPDSASTDARALFRCTYCSRAIPKDLSREELGLEPAELLDAGNLYPYTGCSCGYGKFVRYDVPGAAASGTVAVDTTPSATAEKVRHAEYARIPLDEIRPNPGQPRRFFGGDALRGLASSIAKVGLLEDILVRPRDGWYEIVLGERRWRASQLANAKDISAKIVDLSDEEVRLLAIVENVQRENLSEVEEAFSFKQYVDDGSLITQVGTEFGGFGERIAERLKVLNSHHYIEFQEERINELTGLVDQLRAQTVGGPRAYDAVEVGPEELVDHVAKGYDVTVRLDDGRYLVRRAQV